MTENKKVPRAIGAVCVCGHRHTAAELAELPEEGHRNAPPHMLAERRLARRLIRLVRANGCKRIRVWSGDTQLQKSQHQTDLVRAIVHTADTCTIEIEASAGWSVIDEKLSPYVELTRIRWVSGESHAAIADYVRTSWAIRVFDPFVDQLIEEAR
jgi:hypothetical protein